MGKRPTTKSKKSRKTASPQIKVHIFPKGMAQTIWFSNWNFRFFHVNGKYPRCVYNYCRQTKQINFIPLLKMISSNTDVFRWQATIHFLKVVVIIFYKITKIVRVLWLAKSSVCMRVCKHGCGVKLFGFSRANHASTKFEKVFEFKTRQVYFIYPFLRRLKHGKSLQRRWVNFSSLKLTF